MSFVLRTGFIYAFLLGTCTSLSSTSTRSPSRVVFVAGVRPSLKTIEIEDQLSDVFEKYGAISNVAVHGLDEYHKESGKKRRKPYAFITFSEDGSAQCAIADKPKPPITNEGISLFKSLKPATNDTWRRWKDKPIQKNSPREATAAVTRFAESLVAGSVVVHIVLMVNKSHLQRVIDYIPVIDKEPASVEVVDFIESTVSRTMGLIFLRVKNGSVDESTRTFVEQCLGKDVHVHKALNKVYAVPPGPSQHGNNIIQGTIPDVVAESCRQLETMAANENIVIKVQTYPAKMCSKFLPALEEALENNKSVNIAPTGHTHVLSVVQVDGRPGMKDSKTHHEKADGSAVFLMGVSEAFDAKIGDGKGKDTDKVDVSRAYYKLEEAFDRYDKEPETFMDILSPKDDSPPLTALDCGAAPGGWTQFLLEKTQCSKVYAVDPGNLAPSVSALPGVNHLQIPIASALPLLKKDGEKLDVWTSDMCLHEMNSQVDFLLAAREAGVLNDNALFVLTLKCNVGFSKEAHDNQTEKEVDRLNEIAYGITMMHLFANRSGERTVMGFLR